MLVYIPTGLELSELTEELVALAEQAQSIGLGDKREGSALTEEQAKLLAQIELLNKLIRRAVHKQEKEQKEANQCQTVRRV